MLGAHKHDLPPNSPCKTKKLRYIELAAEAEERGWKPNVHPMELVRRGSVGKSVLSNRV